MTGSPRITKPDTVKADASLGEQQQEPQSSPPGGQQSKQQAEKQDEKQDREEDKKLGSQGSSLAKSPKFNELGIPLDKENHVMTFRPTLIGLQRAKTACRMQMLRIVGEVCHH